MDTEKGACVREEQEDCCSPAHSWIYATKNEPKALQVAILGFYLMHNATAHLFELYSL